MKIGVYDFRIDGGGGVQKKACVLADHFSRAHEVWLITGLSPRFAALEAYHRVDLSRVRPLVLPRSIAPALRRMLQPLPSPLRRAARAEMLADSVIRLVEPFHYSAIEALGLDAFINCEWGSRLRCPASRGLYMCMFPHPLKGALESAGDGSLAHRARMQLSNRLLGMSRRVIDSYSSVTANSGFTAEWIRRMWNVPATVVYSACENMGPPAAAKEKIILNVGRFPGCERDDNKRQDAMIAAFRRLERLQRDGWMLHFAGSVGPSASAKKQVEELIASARALPVVFHCNAPFEELRDLYRRAAVYWHATGFGRAPCDHPKAQEHFGITTVEAMSAGAVPVAIDSGGQREIVTHGSDGFLWQDLDGLAEYTSRLSADAELRRRLGCSAVLSSARFHRDNFCRRVEQLIGGVIREQ